MLPDYERLAIAQLIYYAPALVVSIILSFKHGFGRDQAWFFTTLLCLCRVIGTVCGIAAGSDHNASRSTEINLFIAYYVCNSIGITFLISALLALVRRVNDGLYSTSRIPPRVLRYVYLPLIAAIVLNAISGSNFNSSDPSTREQSLTEAKAGSILVLIVGVGVALVTVYLFSRLHAVQRDGDRTLLWVVAFSLPFLAIRIIYGICVAFVGANPGDTFYRLTPNVWAQAFMSVAEEFIIVSLVLLAGVLVSKAVVDPAQGGHEEDYRQGTNGGMASARAKSQRANFGSQV